MALLHLYARLGRLATISCSFLYSHQTSNSLLILAR